jgi:ribosome-associated protein
MRKSDRSQQAAPPEAQGREWISRTVRRRGEHNRDETLKKLAQELVALKPRQIERLQLDAELLESITHCQSLEDPKARNRQIGVVRQHLRAQGQAALDLTERIAGLKGAGAGACPTAPPPPPEPIPESNPVLAGWVERLAEEGDAALDEFMTLYPGADRQGLRQAARATAKARQAGPARAAALRATARLREALEAWL